MGGTTKYLQQGLNTLGMNVNVDGGMGPKTLSAISQVNPTALMQAASQAQLDDEYRMASNDPRRVPLMPGIKNRIDNRFDAFGKG
jgi:hypothetical protein